MPTADLVSAMNIGGMIECVTGLLESPLVASPLVHAKLVELLTAMLRSDPRGAGGSASRALRLAVLGARPAASLQCCPAHGSFDSFHHLSLRTGHCQGWLARGILS